MVALLPHRARAVLSLGTTLYTLALLSTNPTLRTALLAVFSPRSHPYRFSALLAAILLNLKTAPLAWHVRIFGTMIYQLYLQPTSPLPDRALFRPIVTAGCHTSLFECDYNLHKSNSTYFADLDVGRSALVCALLRNGIRQRGTKFPRSGATSGDGVKPAEAASRPSDKTTSDASSEKMKVTTLAPPNRGLDSTATSTPAGGSPSPASASPQVQPADSGTGTTGEGEDSDGTTSEIPKADNETIDAISTSRAPFTIALGAVSTHFKREVKPYEPFEIWTRVLAWDRKWLYLVSHVVKAGAVRAEDVSRWGLQPWKEGKGGRVGSEVSSPDSLLGGLFKRFSGRSASRRKGKGGKDEEETEEERRTRWQKAIFASSISKYVVKKGRITVPMDEVLRNNGLVPPRPEAEDNGGEDGPRSSLPPDEYKLANGHVESSGLQSEDVGEVPAWTHENVEAERRRGLKLAAKFGALDALAQEFPSLASESAVVGKEEGVVLLGSWPDYVW